MRRAAGTAVLAGACLVLTPACRTAEIVQSPSERLETAVRSHLDHVFGGQPDRAWLELTRRCRDKVPRTVYVQISESVSAAGRAPRVTEFVVHEVSGQAGEVSYRFDEPTWDRINQRWVREDGLWRNDGC